MSEELSAAFIEPGSAIEKTPPISVPVEPPVAAALPPPTNPNVSVLLDVQMPVSICFGRASMPLREVMKLSSGSAVELDRRPDDEVDIIVNNCVIARGEVVVIDGNYGVRVTAIISREQRLALRQLPDDATHEHVSVAAAPFIPAPVTPPETCPEPTLEPMPSPAAAPRTSAVEILRNEPHLSAAELAERAGVTLAYANSLVRRRKPRPVAVAPLRSFNGQVAESAIVRPLLANRSSKPRLPG